MDDFIADVYRELCFMTFAKKSKGRLVPYESDRASDGGYKILPVYRSSSSSYLHHFLFVRPKFERQKFMSCVLFLSGTTPPNLMFCTVQTHNVRCALNFSKARSQKRRCYCYVLRKSEPV